MAETRCSLVFTGVFTHSHVAAAKRFHRIEKKHLRSDDFGVFGLTSHAKSVSHQISLEFVVLNF